MTKFISQSAAQTKKQGEVLAKHILKKPAGQRAVVLALEGGLGSGKTTFLQGLARGLGIKEPITSPTFVIIKRFHVSCSMFHDFYHIDCWRLEKPQDILWLGFKEIISNPKNIVAVEWADKIKAVLPEDVWRLKFSFDGKNIRRIVFWLKKR